MSRLFVMLHFNLDGIASTMSNYHLLLFIILNFVVLFWHRIHKIMALNYINLLFSLRDRSISILYQLHYKDMIHSACVYHMYMLLTTTLGGCSESNFLSFFFFFLHFLTQIFHPDWDPKCLLVLSLSWSGPSSRESSALSSHCFWIVMDWEMRAFTVEVMSF